jgi:hypothetical protein
MLINGPPARDRAGVPVKVIRDATSSGDLPELVPGRFFADRNQECERHRTGGSSGHRREALSEPSTTKK